MSIFPILLVNFIGTLGYSIILPFLIVLVLDFGGNEIVYGLIGATYSFFQLIGAPILGGWSDRIGRKKVLLLSQAGTFLAWLLFIVALLAPRTELLHVDSCLLGLFVMTAPLLLLFSARALDGITGGNVSVANAYLADITREEDRKSNFGKMAASGNLGFIVGPAFAGVLGGTAMGEMLPVLVAAGISLIAIGVIATMLKDSKPGAIHEPVEPCRVRKVMGQEHKECYDLTDGRISFRKVLGLDHMPRILSLYFLIFLAFNFFYVAFPVHAIDRLQWSTLRLGVFFSVLSIVMVVVQGPVLSRISGRFSDGTLTLAGSMILSAGFALFTSSNEVLIFLGVVGFAGGNGIMWPSFLSILSKAAGSKYQGAVQGYASSAGSLASIIGLIIGGLVYGQLGVATFWIPVAVFLFVMAMSIPLSSVSRDIVD